MLTSTLGPPVLCKGCVDQLPSFCGTAQLPQPMGSPLPYKLGGGGSFSEVVGRDTEGMGQLELCVACRTHGALRGSVWGQGEAGGR